MSRNDEISDVDVDGTVEPDDFDLLKDSDEVSNGWDTNLGNLGNLNSR
jgi:hypothetical protein